MRNYETANEKERFMSVKVIYVICKRSFRLSSCVTNRRHVVKLMRKEGKVGWTLRLNVSNNMKNSRTLWYQTET